MRSELQALAGTAPFRRRMRPHRPTSPRRLLPISAHSFHQHCLRIASLISPGLRRPTPLPPFSSQTLSPAAQASPPLPLPPKQLLKKAGQKPKSIGSSSSSSVACSSRFDQPPLFALKSLALLSRFRAAAARRQAESSAAAQNIGTKRS